MLLIAVNNISFIHKLLINIAETMNLGPMLRPITSDVGNVSPWILYLYLDLSTALPTFSGSKPLCRWVEWQALPWTPQRSALGLMQVTCACTCTDTLTSMQYTHVYMHAHMHKHTEPLTLSCARTCVHTHTRTHTCTLHTRSHKHASAPSRSVTSSWSRFFPCQDWLSELPSHLHTCSLALFIYI